MARDQRDLLEPFRRGDPEAIAAVARLARFMIGERGYFVPLDEREDVIQEILVHVYRAVSDPDFRVTRGFHAFVRTIVHRRCVDWRRRHRPVQPLDPDLISRAAGPDESLLAVERVRQGARVLRSLGGSCLRLIRFRVGEGRPYRDIARLLGRSERGVRNQMHKCLKRARALLRATAQSRPSEASGKG